MSTEKARKKLDRILGEVQSRLGEEVGGLMGATLSLANLTTRLVSKEDFFEDLSGKFICAEIDVTGEIEGKGGLLISVKDGIRLGGTLIMLPDNELDGIIATEEYSEELADSYGEIANIIAGGYTKSFEEMYPKDCRFIRKEQDVITPLKVDIESDVPFPNQNYFQVSTDMVLNDKEMGQLIMLLPAGPFEVDEDAPAEESSEQATSSAETAPAESDVDTDDTSTPEATSIPEESGEDSGDTEPADAPASIGMSPDKAKKKLDRVLVEVQSRLGEEVGGLMGATFELTDHSTGLISKEAFFDELAGKFICAGIDVTGELEGKGGLLVSVKDGIRLGGTLLMIPDGELDENVATDEYSEELDDSYGEIANIIAGAYTKTFEEMYPKACRLVRKELGVITAVKVDVESDEPVPDQNYYQVSAGMVLNGKELGTMTMLLPAACFGVDEELSVPDDAPVAEEKSEEAGITPGSEAGESVEQSSGSEEPAQTGEATPAAADFDVVKHKKRVDKCLQECRKRMADEVGALLGADVVLTEPESRIVGKEDYFFDEASGKQILANMDVAGEIEGSSYLFVGLKDAIYIGGTLVMLPPNEIDKVVTDEDFSEDIEDAYGEIANIISGVYTAVFEEQYPQKIRFVKAGLEKVVPLKVDTDSDEPIPDQLYYMVSSNLTIGTREMGKVQMLFPAALFQLEKLSSGEADIAGESSEDVREGGSVTGKSTESVSRAAKASASGGDGGSGDPELLIVSNDEQECAKLTAVFDKKGLGYRVLSYKESVNDYLPGKVKAIFLLMTDVDEKGLGVAIKVSSACSLPLVAAGPEWTRTKVIKAVKYGVDDILLTPASPDDIEEKIDSVTIKLAA